MFVVNRKTGETVRIGTDITLRVLQVTGSRVRIGFAAPAHVHIARQEICEPLGDPSPSKIPNQKTPFMLLQMRSKNI